jgi:hypothetical protein
MPTHEALVKLALFCANQAASSHHWSRELRALGRNVGACQTVPVITSMSSVRCLAPCF